MSRVALVTGGAVRIGRALSLGLAEAGYDVLVHYNTSVGPAREVERKVGGLGRRAVTVYPLNYNEDGTMQPVVQDDSVALSG